MRDALLGSALAFCVLLWLAAPILYLVVYPICLVWAAIRRPWTGVLKVDFHPPWMGLGIGLLVLALVAGTGLASLGPAGGYRLKANRWGVGCSITYVINPSHGSPDAIRATREAADHTAAATGMTFTYEGVTTTTLMDYLPLLQPGSRQVQRPVLITFLPTTTYRSLAHRDGLAAALSIPALGTTRTVTGVIAISAHTHFGRGPRSLRAILQHEWGHIVGLDHAPSDPFELMGSPEHIVWNWGPGDRAGLALLGRQAGCRT